MKVKCSQCGRVFEIPNTQANRALKCLCKNIFVATPLLQELTEEKSIPAKEDSSKSSIEAFRAQFEDTGEIPNPETSTEDPNLGEYVSFLRQSRAEQKKEEEETNTPASIPAFESIEIEIDSRESLVKEREAVEDLELDETTSKSNFQTQPQVPKPNTGSLRARPKEKVNQADRGTSKSFRPPAEPPKDSRKTLASLGILGGVVLIGILYLVFFGNRQKKEEMDPYLAKLLTPGESPAKPRKEKPPLDLPTPKKLETREASLPIERSTKESQSRPSSHSLYEKMLENMYVGDFENVIRLGSTATDLTQEEKAFFFEALFERAGGKADRHQDLMNQVQTEIKNSQDASGLARSLTFGQLKNPAKTKDMARIIETFRSLSVTQASDAFVFYYLGLAYEEDGQLALAHRAWDQALTLAPKFLILLRKRENLYREEKKFDEASKMADLIKNIPDASGEGYIRAAEIALQKKDNDGAIAQYRKAIKIKDSPKLRMAVSQILLKSNPSGAVRELEVALTLDPTSQEKRDLLIQTGRIYCEQKNFDAASNAFRRALKENPRSANLAIEKARCELTAGQNKKAAQSFEKALELSPQNGQVWFDYGQSLLRQEKQRAALEAFKRSLQLKETADAHIVVGKILIQMKKRQEAKNHLKKAVALNPKRKDAKNLLKVLN